MEFEGNTSNTNPPVGIAPGAEKSSDTGSQVQGKASALGRAAADKIDRTRAAAAGGLESAAAALHGQADRLPGGAKVAGSAHAAADALSSTADYVRDNNLKSMTEDVQKLVKNNPGYALLAAVALGFLVARALSRD